jgi:hypothetical protein
MLAATSLGAIWSSCSPDFGVRGVLDRFAALGGFGQFNQSADGFGVVLQHTLFLSILNHIHNRGRQRAKIQYRIGFPACPLAMFWNMVSCRLWLNREMIGTWHIS